MNKWYLTVGNKSKPKLLESYYTLTHDNYDVTEMNRKIEININIFSEGINNEYVNHLGIKSNIHEK